MNEINAINSKLSQNVLHRLGALALALCMAFSLLPAITPDADAAFSDAAMDKLLNWGVVGGYPDGGLHPERSLTRAEFVAMVNRAYGYKELGNTPFIDVPPTAWYSDDINIGYNAKYFNGVSPRMAAPDRELTREQSMVLLARNMRMEPIEGEITEFKDGREFSDWSRGYARAAKEAGIVGGYADGSFKPQNSITRGEMAVMLQRALGTLISKPGTHTLSDVYGNVTVSSPNTVLKDSTIAGNLYITGGLSLGDVTLENVRVLGSIIVAGGGESQSGESVILRNVQADSVVVDSIARQYVSLAAEGDTVIGEALLRSNAYLQDRTRPNGGFLNITLDSPDQGAQFTLSGNLETVVNKTPASSLKIAMGTVGELTVDEEAAASKLELDINSTAAKLNLDTAAEVTGVGDVDKIFVNAPGSKVEMLPDTITIRPGLTANIAGQDMNAQQAQESSSDPRLLAGYPKVKNIAPATATSVYSANKAGTVYWAVSTTTNGSIGEEDLIEPTKDNKRIELNGNLPLEKSETEYTAPFEKLTPDSNYYLSTVLVDARGRRSPIKVASFATPDNTVPAFAQGFPNVMKNYYDTVMTTATGKDAEGNPITVQVAARDDNGFPKRNYRVQVAAMPNKTCQLYYALYPKGSTAPTAQQFRTGSIGKPVRSGVEDATKNRINFIELTNLDELTEYDMYLCLIDADGSLSSNVQKLTFKTIDGKPPRFQYDTPAVAQEALNSLRFNANVNEDARVFWVASKDNNYIKTSDKWSETEWWERACRQIESGANGVSKGTVTARANTDVAINVGGLQPATRYYVYFVAKDSAGNYSEFFRYTVGDPNGEHPEQYTPANEAPYVYFRRVSTLDNIPPEAKQEFTHYDAADNTKPYADTDIRIIFSEPVMQYTTHRDKDQEHFQDLYTLYTDIAKAQAEGDTQKVQNAQDAFYNTLRATVKLYNNAATGNESVVERNESYVENDLAPWVIDYRKATVEFDVDTGEMTLVFHSDPDHPENSALNLSSGATYHFVLDDLCDTSTSKNRMGRYPLPDFTTISAQVQLRSINVTRVSYDNEYHNPNTCAIYGSDRNETIPIDMAFSMTPISTSVEDNVDWDLLFWSDTSCEFEIYELDSNSNGTNAVAIRPLSNGAFSQGTDGHYSVPQRVENVEKPDADTEADNYLGYVGQSYFNKFYGVRGTFPSVTGKGNGNVLSSNDDIKPRGIMERNTPKFYGIHFTKIGNVTEEQGRDKIWDAAISFRISVVTADSATLNDLSQELRNSTVTSFEASRGVSLIHSPKPFTLHKRFANQDAPNFATDYPSFIPNDVTAEMTVMLDRPGTLYYALVPASQWHTETNGNMYVTYNPGVTTYTVNETPVGCELQKPRTGISSSDANYERYYTVINGTQYNVPYNGNDRIVPAYDETSFDPSNLTSKLELVAPASQQIYSQSLANTTGVKTGSIALGSGRESIIVDGLEPETIYLAYFSMQGTGQAYSKRAQLFQFKTTQISRPMLSIQNNTSSAAITSTNMNASVDTGLFLMDSLPNTPLLSQKLSSVLDQREGPEFTSEWASRYNDGTGHNYGDDTVWEAMITPYQTGGSFFDRFASEDVKNAVASLIRTNTQAGTRLDGTLGESLTRGVEKSFAYPKTMQDGLRYILLAVAKGKDNATGHSLGFGAARPLYKIDAGQPTITDIGGRLNVNYADPRAATAAGGYLMDGYITLSFDRPLYLYYETSSATGQEHRDPLTGTMLSEHFVTRDTSVFLPVNTSSTEPVREVRINIAKTIAEGGGISENEEFIVNGKLSGQFSGPRAEQPLSIGIAFDRDTKKFSATVNYADVWFPSNHVSIVLGTLTMPNAADFTLNTTNLGTLRSGETAQLIATLIPEGANGAVRFTSADTSVVGVSTAGQASNAVLVTAGSVTERKNTTISAQLYVNNVAVGSPKTVSVTVNPNYVGSVTANPSTGTLSAASGGSIRVNLSVTDTVGLSATDKAISSTYTLSNDGTNKLSVQFYSTGGDTGTMLITPKTGYVPTQTEIILITVSAANRSLIRDAVIEITLTP